MSVSTTAKLCVPAGAFVNTSCGDWFCPPLLVHAPDSGNAPPSVIVGLVSVNGSDGPSNWPSRTNVSMLASAVEGELSPPQLASRPSASSVRMTGG